MITVPLCFPIFNSNSQPEITSIEYKAPTNQVSPRFPHEQDGLDPGRLRADDQHRLARDVQVVRRLADQTHRLRVLGVGAAGDGLCSGHCSHHDDILFILPHL